MERKRKTITTRDPTLRRKAIWKSDTSKFKETGDAVPPRHNTIKRHAVPMLLRRDRKALKRAAEKKEAEKKPSNPPWKSLLFNSEDKEEIASEYTEEIEKIADKLKFGKTQAFYPGSQKSITCMDIPKSNISKCFTGGKDCCIAEWDLNKGITNSVFRGERGSMKIRGHFGEVLGLAVSEDSKYLVSGGGDKTVRVWDVQNGKQIYYFEGHEDVITVSFNNVFILHIIGCED